MYREYYPDYGDTRLSYSKFSGDAPEPQANDIYPTANTHLQLVKVVAGWRDVDFVYRNEA